MRWKTLSPLLAAAIALASFGGDCRGPDSPVVPVDSSAACAEPGMICTTGTVDYTTIEGGCWSIVAGNNARYSPAGGLPADFKQDGLRVSLIGKHRTDMAGFCPGQIVQVISLKKVATSASPQ